MTGMLFKLCLCLCRMFISLLCLGACNLTIFRGMVAMWGDFIAHLSCEGGTELRRVPAPKLKIGAKN